MGKDQIADTFRRWGYLQADLDPLRQLSPIAHRDLDALSGKEADRWREIYCSKVGVEFMHMPLPERCDWVAERMEKGKGELDRRLILRRILSAETFERFLHTRYVGAKRFSLEGIAAVIPLLDALLDCAAEGGFHSVLIAMSHRGRLNVMYHIAETLAENIIAGFEDIDPKSALGRDDVKYHKGATGVFRSASGKQVHVDLASNPSHLEAINAVLLGRAKARSIRLGDKDHSRVLGVILHGDAAFAGQGVAAEALNFMDIPGFSVGGVIHVVLNNLIGFTATQPALFSGHFATDVARRLAIPIYHVNGESPDDVVTVGRTAFDYRNEFKSDVVIDLIGYRRYGHSEIDDPTITSPRLYKIIEQHPLLFERYAEEIGIAEEDIAQLKEGAIGILEDGLEKGRSMTSQPQLIEIPDWWQPFVGGFYDKTLEVPTAVPTSKLQEITKTALRFPDSFNVHPKLAKGFALRQEMVDGKRALDWGTAEMLALGSLLLEGTPVRLTGQDSRRGTFAHRQAVVYDHESNEEYIPLANLGEKQAPFWVYDSMLSEAAAVGFEYGFSRDYPEALVCWEAQFGDFANGAQIIIDQFITAGEDKWALLSGLVMLLPHGFEGQGPEHSSARLERFLQLAAEDNIQVCQPSTSAQYFHLLRRQALRKWRKPLIVMMPKSMLRAAAACSPIADFSEGKFETVYGDAPEYDGAERLLVCSGKIVHELRAERARRKEPSVAIISLEQLYPLPEEELILALKRYSNAKSVIWVQEEPANMGALFYIRSPLERLASTKNRKVTTVRRSASASPATGSPKAHALEQEAIIKLAFAKYS